MSTSSDPSWPSQTLARPSGSSSTNLPSEAKLLRCISALRETFTPLFDADGNQTRVKTMTGIWQVTYNGENRPIRWESNNQIISNQTILTMTYDQMGRRVTKSAEGGGQSAECCRFVYDGYLQIANRHSTPTLSTVALAQVETSPYTYFIWDPTEPVATRPLVWLNSALDTPHTALYYTHDGNKNESEVVAQNGDIAAHYEYAPFGAVTAQTGALAMANPWRFSSEFADDEFGCDYYNYREYEPMTGRWLSFDPIGYHVGSYPIQYGNEDGINGYLCLNNRLGFVDSLGLHSISDCDYEYDQCCDSCRRLPICDKKGRALCWSGCSIKYGSCLATAHETLISFAVGTAAAVLMCSSGGAAVIFAF